MLVSGVLNAVLGRLTTKAATVEKYTDATVTSGEVASSPYRTSADAAMIARCREVVITYAALVSRTCAGQTMRLYRPANSKGRKAWVGKAVKSRRRNEYLRTPTRGYGPGSKAARWADMAGDVEEVIDHPVLDLLQAANPWMRGTTFSQFCFFQWQIFGRRFIHVVGDGEPESLWCLAAQNTKIIASKETLIGGYMYGRDGAIEDEFTPDEILYQRLCASPFDPYGAIGPLHAAIESIDTYSASTTAELAMWRNGARPDWVLSVPPGTTEAQIKSLDASINGRMKGPNKRGNFLITSITDAKNLQFSNKEMEYLAGRADLRKVIRSAFGVPESVDENNSANLASSLMGHTQFARYTIGPTINQDAEEWSETLLPRYGIEPGEMWFSYDDPVPADRAETRADIQTFIPAGVWSVNEARAEIGFDALEDSFADNHLPSSLLSFASSATAGQAAATDDATEDPAKQDQEPKPNKPADTTVRDTALNGAQVQSLVEVATQIANGQLPESVGKEILLAAFPGIDDARINRIIAGLRNFTPDAPAGSGANGGDGGSQGADLAASKAAPAPPCTCGKCDAKKATITTKDDRQTVEGIEREMQMAVEKWYRRVATIEAVGPSGTVDLTKYEAELAEILRPYVVRMFQTGAATGQERIGRPAQDAFNVFPDRAVGFLNNWTVRLARDIGSRLGNDLSKAIADGMAAGETLGDVSKRVMDTLGEESPWRAERIARTETARAMQQGEMESWKALGYKRMKWMLSPDPCPLCEGFAKQFNAPHDIGAPFMKVGDSFVSATGDVVPINYRDIQTPADLHPNCLLPDTLVAPGSVVAATKARFSGHVVAIRTANGHSLTVTENHQVLTPRGFVAARLLREGDYAIQTGLGQFAGGLAQPQAKNRPPTVAEVFDSLRMSGAVSARSVPVAAEHFHGDGVRLNGEIDVVAVNGLLQGDLDSAIAEAICNRSLFVADPESEPFAASGDFDAMLLSLRLAAYSRVSSSREAASLVGCGAGHADIGRLARVSLTDPGLAEPLDNHVSAASAPLGECIDRLAFLGVEADQIVSVDRKFYSGHVYDLSTVSGAYVAGGIITHNCRCGLVPVDD